MVALGADDEVLEEVEFPVDVDELAVPTSTVCVADEVDVVPDPVEVEFVKYVELDIKKDEELENVVVDP